jgi:branched-chain amino acid transport system permease protein
MKALRYVLVAAAVLLAVTFPLYMGPYPLAIAIPILVNLSLALSWDMLLRSGQISFGIAGFFGIGSYAAALAAIYLGLHPLLTILVSGVVAFVVSLGLGFAVLRLRGMYFAITTLALAEIFRVVIRNLGEFTGGPEGKVMPKVIFGGSSSGMYWFVLAIALLVIVLSEVFTRTRVHFALTSIRNNEIIARSRGVDIFKYLVIIFAVTAALQGMVGGAYARVYGFVTPEGSFHVDFTLLPLAVALLGGIYGTLGPIVGALLLGVVAEYLKLYIPYGHLLVYGIIVVVVILFMPKGIVGTLAERIKR